MRKIGTNWRGSYISTQKRKNTRILWRNHLFYASLTELNESHHWMNPPFILQSRYQEWHAWPLLVGVKVYMYSFNVSLWSTYRNDGLFLILLMTLCYEDVERLNWCSGGYPEGRAAFTSYSNVLKVNCHEGILKLSFRILWVHGAKQPTQNQRNSPIRVWHHLLNPR